MKTKRPNNEKRDKAGEKDEENVDYSFFNFFENLRRIDTR